MNKIFLLLSIMAALYANDSHVQVSVVSPVQKAMNVNVEVQGVVEESDRHTINSPYDGVLHLKTSNMKKVKKGQTIAVIENLELKNRFDLSQSELALYENQLTLELQKEQNAVQMLQMGLISKNDYLSEHSLLSEKKIALLNAKNRLKNLNDQLKKGVVMSPIEGYVTEMLANGSNLSYGSKICTIVGGKVYVKLFVPSFYVVSLHVGQEVFIEGKETKGVISEILPKATDNLVEVVASISVALQSGLHLQAKIVTKSINGWIVPKECIVLVQNRPALYLIKGNTAHLHFVDIQKDMVDKVLLIDDLHKEDTIAYENAYMLDDDMQVEVLK